MSKGKVVDNSVLSTEWFQGLSDSAALAWLIVNLDPTVLPCGAVHLPLPGKLDIGALMERLDQMGDWLVIDGYYAFHSSRSNRELYRRGARNSMERLPPEVQEAVYRRAPELRDVREEGVGHPVVTGAGELPPAEPVPSPPPTTDGGGKAVAEPERQPASVGKDSPPPPPRKRTTRTKAGKPKPDDIMDALLAKLVKIDPKWSTLAVSPGDDIDGYRMFQKLLNKFGRETVVTALQKAETTQTKVAGPRAYPLLLTLCKMVDDDG